MRKAISIGLILIALVIVFFVFRNSDNDDLLGEVHEHADFRVYLNGKEYDFSQEKYMSNNRSLSNFIHLHDKEGNVIHKHSKGISLGFFFETLDMNFSPTCFIVDDGTEFCNNEDKTLKMFVNGKLNEKFDEYEFRDLDRILITYGDKKENDIKKQMDSVTDKACIQSGKCPERGEPSDESTCLTQEGCNIENA